MKPVPLFDPVKAERPMRVAAFMSGSGTNIVRLLELEAALRGKEGSSPFEVVFVFSDRSDGASRGEAVALEHGLPYASYDIRAFHRIRGLRRTAATEEGLAARRAYDRVPALLTDAFDIDVIALGGYMSYTTLRGCVNVHPADLSLKNPDGTRKYVGGHAVLDAIAAGESELRASTLWTDQGVDTGPLLMVSDPVPVRLPDALEVLKGDPEGLARVADEHQERLKEAGDWKIFPLTVEMIARGRFALDEENRVYVDGVPAPEGCRPA
jgi:folate-dependent phosphoribosylglycinamide formyltransferase PurN